MDFVSFINSQEPVASWSAKKKADFLTDAAYSCGWRETMMDEQGAIVDNPVSAKDHLNNYLRDHIVGLVHSNRKAKAKKQITIETVEI